MVELDSTKVLCPLIDKIEILIDGDNRAFSHHWTKCDILIHYRNDFNEQFLKLEWMHNKAARSIHLLTYSMKVLSLTIDLVPVPSLSSLMTS